MQPAGLPVISQQIVDGIIATFGEADKINLSNNRIKVIEDMSRMNFMRKLNLSRNELKKVTGLRGLTNLVELNLSQNQITDLSGIEKMSSLAILDLSQNLIPTLDSIQCLTSLQSLESLNLSGNPCCQQEVYPQHVFTLLPQLSQLDGRNRFEFGDMTTQHIDPDVESNSSSAESKEEITPISPPLSQTEKYYLHKIRQLERELAGFKEMFVAQELCICGITGREKVGNSHDDERECCFALLTLWREQVHREMMMRILAQDREKQIASLRKAEMNKCQETIQSLTKKLTNLSKEFDHAKILIEEQQQEIEKEKKEKLIERELRGKCQARANKIEDDLLYLRSFLGLARERIDQEIMAGNVIESKIEHRMVALEGRIEGARERIKLLETLLQMKEVELRNSQSLLAAERKLFWIREERRKDSTETVVDDFDSNSQEIPVFLSDLIIAPEVEALLGTFFRHLDPSDSGTISVTLLLTSLQTAQDHGLLPLPLQEDTNSKETIWSLLLRRLEELLHHPSKEEPNLTWGELLLLLVPEPHGHPDSWILEEHNFSQSQGNELHSHRIDALCICMCENCIRCEWKEKMLLDELHRKPNSKRNSTHVYGRQPLSHNDFFALQQARLLNDCQWAMIPLQIAINPETRSSPPGKKQMTEKWFPEKDLNELMKASNWLLNIAKSGCCNCVGIKHECCDLRKISQEAVRLAGERAYLLKRVQFMNRSLERRAESIRGFFETELRRGDIRLQKANHQLADCQSSMLQLEERFQSHENRLKSEKRELEDRLQMFQAANQTMEEKITTLMDERDSDMNKQLGDAANRCNRLESELKILRKEFSKNEVAKNTLQRELVKIQGTYVSVEEKLAHFRDEKEDYERKWKKSQEELGRCREQLEKTEKELETELLEREHLQKEIENIREYEHQQIGEKVEELRPIPAEPPRQQQNADKIQLLLERLNTAMK